MNETDVVNDLYIVLNLAYAEYYTNPEAWIAAHPNKKIPIEYSYDQIEKFTTTYKDNEKYQEWLAKRYQPKIVRSLDSDNDYPQYDKMKAIDDLTAKRERAKEAKKYHRQLTNF